MRILFLGLNYAPEQIGIAVYTSGLCEDLVARGHQVRVIAAQPYYPSWKVFEGFGGWWKTTSEGCVELTRCPIYVPARPTGARRILHHASFALSAFVPMLRAARCFKPDIVMTVAPSLIGAPVAWLAARLVGARSWLHIQDFEVEAAFATGLLEEKNWAARIARKIERRVIRSFDQVSSISPEMCRKLREMGVAADRTYEFRNWANLSKLRPMARPSRYRQKWNIETPHVVLYSGNIANKQGIDIVVDAARLLVGRKDLTFVVCGDGPNRAALESRAAGLPNIQFHSLQPRDSLLELLDLATIHLLPQRASAADLVLPSKLINMLASGRPVVATAASGTGLAREVEGAGLIVPPEQAGPFAEAIGALLDDPELYRRSATTATRKAEELWTSEAVLGRFVERLEQVAAGK